MTAAQRFARLVTDLVVRRPELWRLFRGPLRGQFDRLAPRWDSIRSPGHLASLEAALARLEGPPPRRALDVGTGTGDAAFLIARRFAEAEVTGLDLSPAMVARAKAKTPAELAPRVRFEAGDASRLPFADASFDLVVLANMIPFFDELARVAAPGAAAVVSYALGPGTPIYVPPDRLRRELGRRGFAHFADVATGRGTALLARRGDAG